MSACKKFPGSKGQIEELPFWSDQRMCSVSADTQSLMLERLSTEWDTGVQTSQAHNSMSWPLFPFLSGFSPKVFFFFNLFLFRFGSEMSCPQISTKCWFSSTYTLSMRHQVFFRASKKLWPLCVPGPSSLTWETWGETLSLQKLRPNGSKDNQTFSLPLCSDARRPEDISFLPGCSLTSQSLFLIFDHPSMPGGSPSARMGEKPFQKAPKAARFGAVLQLSPSLYFPSF